MLATPACPSVFPPAEPPTPHPPQPRRTCPQVQPDMSKGQWNLRNPRGGDLAFVEGASIRSYLVVNFERSANTGAIMKFVDMFERMARRRGWRLWLRSFS